MKTIDQILQAAPVIPVIVVDRLADAVPLGNALINAGLRVLEVTLRSECALPAIEQIRANCPGAIVGAGTVLNSHDAANAAAAGAEFIVSPGCTESLLDATANLDLPFLPGVNSLSEIMRLMERGLDRLKFFPAEAAGGIPMLKAIHGPLPSVRFCPTGGINASNFLHYLSLPNVSCVGGSWMLNPQSVAEGDWGAVEKLARDIARAAAQ